MASLQNETAGGVLNTGTLTIHKHEIGASDFHTECGHTHYVDPDSLQTIDVEQAVEELNASKCGECFEDAGGY